MVFKFTLSENQHTENENQVQHKANEQGHCIKENSPLFHLFVESFAEFFHGLAFDVRKAFKRFVFRKNENLVRQQNDHPSSYCE